MRHITAAGKLVHLADWVRFRACLYQPGSSAPGITGGSWFLDCDTIWFQGYCTLPSRSGHIFGSMPAPATIRGHRAEHFWQTYWLRKPREPLWLAVPFHFPANSPLLASVVARVDECLSGPVDHRRDYNIFMDFVKDAIHTFGFHLDVLDAAQFCAKPRLDPFKKSKAQPFRHRSAPSGLIHGSASSDLSQEFPEMDQIFNFSSGMNQIWFTSKYGRADLSVVGKQIEPRSFYRYAFRRLGLQDMHLWPKDFCCLEVRVPALKRQRRSDGRAQTAPAPCWPPAPWWRVLSAAFLLEHVDLDDAVRVSAVAQMIGPRPICFFGVLRSLPAQAHQLAQAAVPAGVRIALRGEAAHHWHRFAQRGGLQRACGGSYVQDLPVPLVAQALLGWAIACALATVHDGDPLKALGSTIKHEDTMMAAIHRALKFLVPEDTAPPPWTDVLPHFGTCIRHPFVRMDPLVAFTRESIEKYHWDS